VNQQPLALLSSPPPPQEPVVALEDGGKEEEVNVIVELVSAHGNLRTETNVSDGRLDAALWHVSLRC